MIMFTLSLLLSLVRTRTPTLAYTCLYIRSKPKILNRVGKTKIIILMKKLFLLVTAVCCTLMAQAELISETLTCDGSTTTTESEHFSLVATGVDATGWTLFAYQNDKITINAKDGEKQITKIKLYFDNRSNDAPFSGYVICTPGNGLQYTWDSFFQEFTEINASSIVISITGSGCHVQRVEVFFEGEVVTALDNATSLTKGVKMIENGQVVIRKGRKNYSVLGQEL